LRLTFGDFFGQVAQAVALGSDRLHGGQLLRRVALPGDALAPDFGGTQPAIQAGRAKLGVCLALALDDGLDIRQQVRERVFGTFATSGCEGIETRAAALSLMGALAKGASVPTPFALRTTLATWPQLLDSPRHKEPAGAPFEGLGSRHEQGFERVGSLHTGPSSMR
jgi:hypothetical protein